ncbi:2OG-Fe(II) oxygenase [Sphaerisporangium sp. NPDC088356]|uniref:2OG-Fe(II) oxygenase n=1 Tax=Sphaerisporangium sp. NPDC088356 TaxID=3154871 RepID=UPI00341D06E0
MTQHLHGVLLNAPQLNERTFPATLDELLAECAANGQHRSTPLILQYGPGDYACLHQDIYGVFPLQIAIMLNQPGEDFTGGENRLGVVAGTRRGPAAAGRRASALLSPV